MIFDNYQENLDSLEGEEPEEAMEPEVSEAQQLFELRKMLKDKLRDEQLKYKTRSAEFQRRARELQKGMF